MRERPVLAFERRMALADLLEQNPVLTVDDLARRFNVSAQTVRRDFQYLEQRGLITRAYGGAVARNGDPLSHERTFLARETERSAQKQAIARVALAHVEPGSTVIVVANSRQVIALIDASKLERTALSFFAPVAAIDVLVTDDGADPQMVAQLHETGLQVHMAPVAP